MIASRSLVFSIIVRTVAGEARRLGLTVPIFRSPPGLPTADRTICWRHGERVVAVRSAGRSSAVVTADVIDGILVANGLAPDRALLVRRRLLKAVEAELAAAA